MAAWPLDGRLASFVPIRSLPPQMPSCLPPIYFGVALETFTFSHGYMFRQVLKELSTYIHNLLEGSLGRHHLDTEAGYRSIVRLSTVFFAAAQSTSFYCLLQSFPCNQLPMLLQAAGMDAVTKLGVSSGCHTGGTTPSRMALVLGRYESVGVE